MTMKLKVKTAIGEINKKMALEEAELKMRLLLDAAMRHHPVDEDNEELTDRERAFIKSWRIRDTEVWCGNVSNYDVVEDALWGSFAHIGEYVLEKLLDGDEDEYEKVTERLCERGPGGAYRRFMFIERP